MNFEYCFKEVNENIIKKDSFFSKLSQLKLNDLLIVADFDYTLSKRYVLDTNNTKTQLLCGFGFYDFCPHLPETFRKNVSDLKKKYIGYESDFSIPFETRDKFTKKLYEDDLKMISDLHLSKNFIDETINDTIKIKPFYFRNGIGKFFDIIEKNSIPLVIVSGGLKEVISKVISLVNKDVEKNVTIISNEFVYGNDGKAIDYKKPIVYAFNKSQISEEKILEKFTQEQLKTKSIIFLGDHVNDIDTIEKVPAKSKLGFAFDNFTENREKYLEKYDCVILNDGSFSVVNEVLEALASQ